MKRIDRIKLALTRNWKLPGKERLSQWLRISRSTCANLSGSIVWLTEDDIAIYTTADNYIEWKILAEGNYEEEVGKLIRISLKKGGVALDIGANIGLQSIRMAQCAGDTGRVIAFEPLIFLQRKFERNMALNRLNNVQLLPYALSDEHRTTVMNIAPGEWNQGAFNISGKKPGSETQVMEIRTGDELPEISGLRRLDLVKIDVEGYEFQVIRGLARTLEKFRPRILFEYDTKYWQNSGQQLEDCYNLLRELGYDIYQVEASCCQVLHSAKEAEGGNLFCINSSYETNRA